MKTIYILRHAKSDWSDATLSDFERPLSAKGIKAANMLGLFLGKLEDSPQYIISSPAKRTKMTTDIVANYLDKNIKIDFFPEIYNKTEVETIEIIKSASSEYDSLLIIGHNPNLENLICKLVSDGKLNLKLTTCGLAKIKTAAQTWSKLQLKNNLLSFLISPKCLH
jgi:phosphohistidine phosphatase